MKILIVFTFLLVVISSHATTLGAYDQSVYEHITSLCKSENMSLEVGLKFVESMKHSVGQFKELAIDLKDAGAKSALRNRGLSEEMASILDSEGFYSALRNCYPNSQVDRDRLAFSLILADSVGRLVGTVQGVTAMILTGRVLSTAILGSIKIIKGTKYGLSLVELLSGVNKYYIGGIALGIITVDAILNQKNNVKIEEATAAKEAQSIYAVLDTHIYQWNLRINFINGKKDSENCKLIKEVLEIQRSFLDLLKVSPPFIQHKYAPHKQHIMENQISNC